jgi:hypothetical protein
VFAITNNHNRGQAFVNAIEIEAGLGKKGIAVPPSLVEAYPRLRRLIL